MPETTNTNSPALAVELNPPAGPSTWGYVGGQTITGNIVRRQPLVSPEATVGITLCGRAKSKITVRRQVNNSTRYEVHRGRIQFFGGAPAGMVSRVAFQGPVHIPGEGVERWPFSVTLPAGPMIRVGDDEMVMRDVCLMPLFEPEIAKHCLPGTFSSRGGSGYKRSECFVEYFLVATLQYLHGGDGKTLEATCPIFLRQPSSPLPITDFKVLWKGFDVVVKSHRLSPGLKDGHLSFKQKTQQVFGSSKVPGLGLTLQVHVPTVVQLNHPRYVPIGLLVIPSPGRTSEGIRDEKHDVVLKSVKIVLCSDTMVVAPRGWRGEREHEQESNQHLGLERAFTEHEPVILPQGPPGADAEPLDIGQVLKLTLTGAGLTAGGRRLGAAAIHPTFTTYNIRHLTRLEWKIVVAVAGEEEKVTFVTDVDILSPPDLIPPVPLGGMPGVGVGVGEASGIGGPSSSIGPMELPPAYDEVAGPAKQDVRDVKGGN